MNNNPKSKINNYNNVTENRKRAIRAKEYFNLMMNGYKKILNALNLNKDSNEYKNKVSAFKQHLNIKIEKNLLGEQFFYKFDTNRKLYNIYNYSKLLPTPPAVSTVYMTREMLKNLKDLKEKTTNGLKKIINSSSTRLSENFKKEVIKERHTREVKIRGIVYSKSKNKYCDVNIVLNENNKLDVYKVNYYNFHNVKEQIYSDIDLKSSNMNNMNNIVLSNGEEVKVIIVSPKKYILLEELVKRSF
jgi:hypothetical protein